MLASLARFIHRHRLAMIGAWLALIVFGGFGAKQMSKRWFQQFSIPGYSAYETNQKIVHTFHNGEAPPVVLVFHSNGDVTKQRGIRQAVLAGERASRDSRSSSFFSTGNAAYVSADRHTTFAEVYPPGQNGFGATDPVKKIRSAVRAATPAGVTVNVTGEQALEDAAGGGGNNGPSILTEALIGGAGALVILLFVFGTIPAIGMPLAVAIASIFTTFGLVWLVSYLTNVSQIVEFLIALVGLGVAIDYALLMIFRFREELGHGEDIETALTETMSHAGRSVIVSGSTVAVGLLSMIALPLPFIRSIGIAGMFIPAVSVVAALTLLPALLSLLGHRINRLRVMPRRIVEHPDADTGFWNRWAGFVMRRPVVVAVTGLAVVGALVFYGAQLNPARAQAKDLPGSGDAIVGRQALADAGFSPGVMEPFVVLVRGGDAQSVAARLRKVEGVDGAAAPTAWRRGDSSLVEAFPDRDGEANATKHTMSRVRDVLPENASLGGVAPENRDFVHAVYGNFPYALGFVVLLTFLLLARAFGSLVLPFKAVILNLVSLVAAYGIVVFIFQKGHGSHAIWGVNATGVIQSWIPLMVFAFLFGLSMDYEVFILARMREEYDATGSTDKAVVRGIARTGRLVTSAALILFLAFISLASGPETEVKVLATGLAAGILLDATVIRALLVPAVISLFGRWNWWLPARPARWLRVEPSLPPQTAPEGARG
jgi:putative drug exporter of the RND superfamily